MRPTFTVFCASDFLFRCNLRRGVFAVQLTLNEQRQQSGERTARKSVGLIFDGSRRQGLFINDLTI